MASDKQVFVKSAERQLGMSDLDFQNPQAGVRMRGEITEVATAINRMGEITDAVALDIQIELPAHRLCLRGGVVVQRHAGHAFATPKVFDPIKKCLGSCDPHSEPFSAV